MGWGWAGACSASICDGPEKKEGDDRAPAGIFRLSSAFGYAPRVPPRWVKLPYLALSKRIEGIDDPNSRYYNKLVDRSKVAKIDWRSSEQMRRDDVLYKWGVVVDHNPAARPGAGSCIFLHIWKSPSSQRPGAPPCRERSGAIASLAGSRRQPILIQMPRAAYRSLQGKYDLAARSFLSSRVMRPMGQMCRITPCLLPQELGYLDGPMSSEMYDVAIIGGGPAGSTAATLLAQAGRRVIVLEREKFPRFHIGESLLPFSTQAFDRLGVREKLNRTFMPKHGGEIMAACGTKRMKFYFKDGYKTTRDRAYQVTRSEFDKLLLDHSRENGAEVREETEVKKIEFGRDRVRLEVVSSAHSSNTPTLQSPTLLEARYLLDCSGRQTILGNFFKLKKMYDHLQKFSVFAHYENVDRPSGIDGTLIRMVRGLDRWFWMIPLTPTRMSIGVVMDTSTFRAMKLPPEEALEKCIDEQPLILAEMANAKRVSQVYSAGDYSYRNKNLFGDRWLLAGDAAGFIDPVFSSGVFLAIMSAEKAADSLNEILRDESNKPRLFRRVLAARQPGDGHVSHLCEFMV